MRTRGFDRGIRKINRSTTALDAVRVGCAMDGMATDVCWQLRGRAQKKKQRLRRNTATQPLIFKAFSKIVLRNPQRTLRLLPLLLLKTVPLRHYSRTKRK